MSRLSPDQVIALAPDPSAAAAARGVANASKWESAGSNDMALWGEAKGSAKTPYQTAVDLSALAFKCTCPSRKLPCKHTLGLLLRHSNGEVPNGTAPNWVDEWLEKRADRAVKQEAKASSIQSPPDPGAAAKRAEKRWSNILAGLEECDSFMQDAVSQGLLAVQSARSWDQMAARMIDAQAPGVATRLKRIGSAIGVGESWAQTVTGQLGNLCLLTSAARHLDEFDEGLRSDVRTALGIPTRKEDLGGEVINSVWDVLGQVVEVEDRITACRSWLQSRSDGRWAMHLAFSVAGQSVEVPPIPGSAFRAEAQFYPSAWPQRVNLGERNAVAFQPAPGSGVAQCLEFTADALSSCPWVEYVPVHLEQASISKDGNAWFALDADAVGLPLRGPDPWKLLAMSGNNPCHIFGEWNGVGLRILSAWGEWGYLAL